MKAVGLQEYLPIEHPASLLDLTLPIPEPGPHDLLVKIEAVSVNPVDYKMRAPRAVIDPTDPILAGPRVLGWDAAGTVVAVGEAVTLFQPGDDVFYAGSITRPGANSEYHVVDERIVGHKPTTLSFSEAAALPLTALTACEALFDRLMVRLDGADRHRSILVIGGAGGVGSIALQLAKQVAQLTVIATASREASVQWCHKQGADMVINHFKDMSEQLKHCGYTTVDWIFCLSDTDHYFDTMAHLIAPEGRICGIVETKMPHDLERLKAKSASFVWEFMFTRAMFQTDKMIAQHHWLNQVAQWVDEGVVTTSLSDVLGPICAENLKKAHQQLEAGRVIGKLVLAGF